MSKSSGERHLSPLAVWALAFGCSVGWDAVVQPWTTFLPNAGPIGTMLGIFVGGIVMAVIAWNFHYMINRKPGPGGVYAYATEAFGHDHGYLCAWFLSLTYSAIVWSDTAALPIIVRYMFGDDFFNFGFRYVVAGFEVCLGDIVIGVITSVGIALLCFRRRLSCTVQTILAFLFAIGFAVCFMAAAIRHDGGLGAFAPAFSPTGGHPFVQFLSILTAAPWLFIGFETIASMSGEARFQLNKSFGIMIATLVSSVIAYVILTAIPVLVSSGDPSGWTVAVSDQGDPNVHAFDAAGRSLGGIGTAVVCCALVGAILTNLIGNTIVASRLISAMAKDGALPRWLGEKTSDDSPRNAVIAIVSLAIIVSLFGQTAISITVDVALVGAAVAYAYTSAATLKIASHERNRLAMATGLAGLVLSLVIGVLFLLPIFSSDVAMMATESYILLLLWCIAGITLFLQVFRHDNRHRFGRSSVVWISLFVMIVLLSVIWIRQTNRETTDHALDALLRHHENHCRTHVEATKHIHHGESPDSSWLGEHDADDWRAVLKTHLSKVDRTITRNNLIQAVLNVFALALMFILFRILRRRERDMEYEKAKAKSYFFSTVSHDIRTPLNAIIGFSEMLKSGFKTETEREQAIDSILVSGKTLLGLINDVLDLSKLESGKMDILPEPTDLPRLMQMVMSAFRASGAKPDLELRCRTEDMPRLMLDPQRLRQIVFNLVGNAVKFTERGHVELRASFKRAGDSVAGVLRLAVEDTGCGISEENKKQIGSAYVQLGSKLSRNGGTGLGLAICKQLVAAMGGRMEVESTLGEGSIFTIVIPNVRVASESGNDPDNGKSDIQAKASATAQSESSAVGSCRDQPPDNVRRILVVDDAKMNLMVLKALLKNLGDYEIETAMDGLEAMKVLEAPDAKPFDLVLTDMWMPNMDGEGLIKAIRANPTLKSLRVIAVTADVESQGSFASLGFDGILLKPVTGEKLRKMLGGNEQR